MPVRRHKKQTDVSGVTAGVASMAVQQPKTAEWVEYKDPQNRPYYYNVVTKQTTWVKPEALVVQPPPAQAPETTTQSSNVAHTTQAQTAQPSYQLPSNQGMGSSSQGMGSANQGMGSSSQGMGSANQGMGPQNPLSSDLTKSSDPADDIWGKKDKDANKPDEGFWSLSVQERVTNCLRGGVTPEMDMGRGGNAWGGRIMTEGEPMNDEIGGNKVVCSLKIGEKGGAGIRFIYARIGWWVYAVNPDPGQPDIKPKDLIVGINGKNLYTCKNQGEQVAIVKENFKEGAQVEVRRGLELPPGHMDDSGKWIPAEINPYTGEPRGPMKAIDGLGMRECTKYLHISNMNKKTHWVALRKFIKEISGCETERTEILRRALGKKKSESRGEALVQMKSVDDALKVVQTAQGSEIDENQIIVDFTFKKPSHSSGGYQTGISTKKGAGRYTGHWDAERMCRNDAEKIGLHDAVAAAIVDKLRSNNGLLTQHWVGKHLNRVFGCGIIRKLVFMEPLDFYNSRSEFNALLDTMNLGANNQVQAFKVQLADGYEGDMRNRRPEGRQVWGKDGPRRDDRGGGRFGGRSGGGGGRHGGGRYDGNLMAEIGGPNKFGNRNAGQGSRPGPGSRGNRQVQGYGGAAVDLE